MKKFFLLPVLALFSSVVLAQDVKFFTTVTGSNAESLNVEVYSDYSFAVQLPGEMELDQVNIAIGLTDVASLGIKGSKTIKRTLDLSLGKLDLANILTNCYNFDGAKISFVVKDAHVVYNFSRVENVIFGVPEDVASARLAFKNMISQCEVVENETADSYIKLAAGSGIAIANEAVYLTSDLKLFDGEWTVESTIADIRGAVSDIKDLGLEGAKTFSLGASLAAGSVFSLGHTSLVVKGDISTNFDISGAFDEETQAEMPNILSVVQEIMNDDESGDDIRVRTAKALAKFVKHFDEVVGYVEEAGEVEAEAEVQEAPTAIETIGNSADASVRKAMVNGQLVIIRDGVRYNAIGQIAE